MRYRDSEEMDELFFPISPFMIFPEAYGQFGIYLRKGRNYLLFTRQGEEFSRKHKNILHENGIEEVYIESSQKPSYDRYLEENLDKVLSDDSIPLPVRSSVLYYAARQVMDDLFKNAGGLLDKQMLDKLANIVRSGIGFFSLPDAMKTIAPMMSRNFKVSTHCVHVFIYSAAIFETLEAPEQEKTDLGLGAILHDIGKFAFPKMVLYKRGRLNLEERELIRLHPAKGVGVCSQVPLGQICLNCILFHHEQGDGSGYPAGLTMAGIPLHAKIVAIADVFDGLTTRRSFAEPISADRALTVMRENFTSLYDPELLETFAEVLTEAGVAGLN